MSPQPFRQEAIDYRAPLYPGVRGFTFTDHLDQVAGQYRAAFGMFWIDLDEFSRVLIAA